MLIEAYEKQIALHAAERSVDRQLDGWTDDMAVKDLKPNTSSRIHLICAIIMIILILIIIYIYKYYFYK